MVPLLRQLQTFELGLTVNDFYVGGGGGGGLRADDIRTLATSEASSQEQVKLINHFTQSNFLKLNLNESLSLVKECHFLEEHVWTGALHCR